VLVAWLRTVEAQQGKGNLMDGIPQIMAQIQQLDAETQRRLIAALLILYKQPAGPLKTPTEPIVLKVPYTRDYDAPRGAVLVSESCLITAERLIWRAAIKDVKLGFVQDAGWEGRSGTVEVVLIFKNGQSEPLGLLAHDEGRELATLLRPAKE
jgi:hypothetical protein